MKRSASAVLLALTLLLTACSGNQSGDSNSDNLQDEAPGQETSQGPS